MIMTGVFCMLPVHLDFILYVTCASGFELTHTLNTLYNHIHVQYCSILLCTYKI